MKRRRRLLNHSGAVLPSAGLVFKALVRDGLVDTIGESVILYQSGNASSWQTTAVWGFEYNATMAAIDTLMGGNVLFIGTTPRYFTWAGWMGHAAVNDKYLFLGIEGIAAYNVDQSSRVTRIRRYLDSVDQELLISEIFNGFDTTGLTISGNSPTALDKYGRLQDTASNFLAVSGSRYSKNLIANSLDLSTGWTLQAGCTIDTIGGGVYRYNLGGANYDGIYKIVTDIPSGYLLFSCDFKAESAPGVVRVSDVKGGVPNPIKDIYVTTEWERHYFLMGPVQSGSYGAPKIGKFPSGLSSVLIRKMSAVYLPVGSTCLYDLDYIETTGSAKSQWYDTYYSYAKNFSMWGDSLTANYLPAAIEHISRRPIYNGGVGGETSTQIKTRFLAATDKHGDITVIWAGRNNHADGATVLADIAEMVAELTTEQYYVMSILNAAGEVAGSGPYEDIIAINSQLEATYGAHYIDIRSYLISQYDPEIPQDVIDHDNGVVPSSLRTDTLHLSFYGYIVAGTEIHRRMVADGIDVDLHTNSIAGRVGIRTLSGTKEVFAEIDPTVWKRAKIDKTSIQYFKNTATPASHTTNSLPTGTYTLWMEGTGSVQATAGTAVGTFGTATAGTPATITITTAGTVNITCTGEVTWGQLENSPYPTSKISNTTGTFTRNGTNITIPTADRFQMVSATESQNFALFVRVVPGAAGQVVALLGTHIDSNNRTYIELGTAGTAIKFNKAIGGVFTSPSKSYTHVSGVPVDIIAIQTDQGMSIKYRTYSGGAWSSWSTWADNETAGGKAPAKVAATMYVGALSGSLYLTGNIPVFGVVKLGSRSTLAEYKSVAEREAAKIHG